MDYIIHYTPLQRSDMLDKFSKSSHEHVTIYNISRVTGKTPLKEGEGKNQFILPLIHQLQSPTPFRNFQCNVLPRLLVNISAKFSSEAIG